MISLEYDKQILFFATYYIRLNSHVASVNFRVTGTFDYTPFWGNFNVPIPYLFIEFIKSYLLLVFCFYMYINLYLEISV